MTRLFLDTNIVVDLLDRREPFWHDASRLFAMAYSKKVQLVVSPITFSTASYLLHKHGSDGVHNLLFNFRQLVCIATAHENIVDNIIDIVNSLLNALAQIAALVAVAELESLEFTC